MKTLENLRQNLRILLSDLLVKYNLVLLILSKTITSTYDYIKWYSSTVLLHFVIRCPYLQNNPPSMDSSPTHICTLNSGNLKIFVWIIFSQNYEFSKLRVPSNYLIYPLCILVTESNGIQRKHCRTVKPIKLK